jgi:NAD+ synthase (glutamine-hydrolysing)
MNNHRPFECLYAHGFVRVAVCTPQVRIASPNANAERTLELVGRAVNEHAAIAVFPELGLSGYSIEDLVLQDAVLDAVKSAVKMIVDASRALPALLVIGAPVRSEQRLFNCALVIQRGQLLGVVPKTYLPNYREFYEKRHYSSAAQALSSSIQIGNLRAPFGNDLLFAARNVPDLLLHVEICEDLWVPIPPSTYAALAGAVVLANLSASNITVGKADYRRLLCTSQSAKCIAAYLYAAAGYGESTTDLAWDGHALICENGEILAESRCISSSGDFILADIDLERLRQERTRTTSFSDCVELHRERLARLRRIEFNLELPAVSVSLQREVPRFPYVPSDEARLDERCSEVYQIQVQGLARRMQATGIGKPIVGVSGGLDSTHALIVAAKAVDQLRLPRSNVLAYTLPGLATSGRTHENAHRLMHALDVTAQEIDISASVMQTLRDIGHPYARGEKVHDATFENVQAGARASYLFRLANLHGGLVVGTSDLSELALGYTTYGVGDHMAHYAVNASVPKSLIRHLIRRVTTSGELGIAATEVLGDILVTISSPELVPDDTGAGPQSAEAVVGPYELQDFNLYYTSRFGFRPSKVAFLAVHAWSKCNRGAWPAGIPVAERREYDLSTIERWLRVFIKRFFETSQFKRSALPDGPKVGSGGSLSPRSDWRAPSDATAEVWLEELAANLPPAR